MTFQALAFGCHANLKFICAWLVVVIKPILSVFIFDSVGDILVNKIP